MIEIENNKTANKKVLIKYAWYLNPKTIEIKLTRKLTAAIV